MNQKQLIIDGHIVSYLDNEKTEKPVFLFLHGWGCDKNTFKPLFQLFKQEFRVISIDFPGFGQSALKEEGMNILDYAEHLECFIQKLQLNNVHAVTHSFGGRVAMRLAAKEKSVFTTLTLINCGGIKNDSLKITIIHLLAKIGKFFGLGFLKKVFYKLFIKEEDALALENSQSLKKTFQKVVREDLQVFAKQIECPILILWGEQDQSTPLWQGKRWHELIKNSQFFSFPGDHFVFLQKPAELKEKIFVVLKKFL